MEMDGGAGGYVYKDLYISGRWEKKKNRLGIKLEIKSIRLHTHTHHLFLLQDLKVFGSMGSSG